MVEEEDEEGETVEGVSISSVQERLTCIVLIS